MELKHHESLTSHAYRTLHLLRRTSLFQQSSKKQLAISSCIVGSQLTYRFQLWRPYLIKDIQILKKVQCCAKNILNSYISSYKSQLTTLHLLLLMYLYELNDIIFLIKSLKNPSSSNIHNFISFTSYSTRLSARNKLIHHRSTSTSPIISILLESPIYGIYYQWLISLCRTPLAALKNIFIATSPATWILSSNSFHILCPCCRCSYPGQTAT